MASTFGFCSLPSISFGQKSFKYRIVFSQSAIPHSRSTQISSQQPVSEVTINSDLKILNLSQLKNKKNISYKWVNPKSPKASQFRPKSYDLRYTSLAKVAESLNSCLTDEKDVFDVLDRSLGGKHEAKDGVIILDNVVNPQTARIVLKYFEGICDLSSKIVLYNVTLKVFRKCKDLYGAEQLFDEMLQRGITPDNITFSTIIGCAQMSSLPSKAVSWFERMPEFRIQPDVATNALMIDSYGRVGNVKMALQLYDRSRIEKWKLSTNTFTTLIRLHGTNGNFDGCLKVFVEMKALGIKPNLICYNTLLDALCRAKIPWEIKSIHQEILSSGLSPGFATYASLLRAYCKSHCGDEAMKVYKVMMAKGMELNTLLYNTLLRMCVDLGFVDEAASIFEDMKRSMDGQPNSRTFSSLITIYSTCGKVSEAETTLEEMLEAGFKRDVYVLSDLIQCYWKSDRMDDVVRTLDRIMELDITPDDRSCICLLKVMRRVPWEELGKVTRCIERANPKVGDVVKMVVVSSDVEDEMFKNEVSEVVSQVGDDARKTFCSCLIDLCIYLQRPEKARYVGTLV